MQKTNPQLHTAQPRVQGIGTALGPPAAKVRAVKPLQVIYTQDLLPIKQVWLHRGIQHQLEHHQHCWILHKHHQIKLELEWVWLRGEHYSIITTPHEQLVHYLPGVRL
jgi:hypothetical protein